MSEQKAELCEQVQHLSEAELQTGSVVRQRERENSIFCATVSTGSDSGWVKAEVPGLYKCTQESCV